MTCPKCGVEAPEGALFCEADGTRLSPLEAASSEAGHCRCGAGPEARDDEGYCTACGHTWPVPSRDHKEIVLSGDIAGVSDLGKRHSQNQDDFTVAVEQVGDESAVILIVCDGVSSADRAAEASAAATKAACECLQQGLHDGHTDRTALLRDAVRRANQSVLALPSVPSGAKDPPETTIVAALVLAGSVTLAWVGDSRAYRIGSDGAKLLTHDHSWVNEMVDAGQISLEEAQKSPQAHAITRCLGLEGEEAEPGIASFALSPAEGLLLCSDGLWNYAESELEIGRLLSAMPAGTDAVSACRALTDFALNRGGRDNVTVVLMRPVVEGKHT